jgi:DNA-binding MarR family transcriptional regulator
MSLDKHNDVSQQVILDGRENGISYTLFRNAIGKKMGLNTTDFEGLDLIFFRGASTPSELARYTGLSSGSTTAMIDRLEKTGLVNRQANPHDRRGTLVVVNKKAAQKFSPLFMSARVAQQELLDGFSQGEKETLSRYFKMSAAMFEEERKKILDQS